MTDVPPVPSTDPVRVLYVGGWGRSGSTLLDRMLGQVPGFLTVGELREIWQRALLEDRPCGCGEMFSACPFWRKVGEVAYGGWDRVDLPEVLRLRFSLDRPWTVPALVPRRVPRMDAALRRYEQILAQLYRAIGEVSGARVIVDSSKLPSHAFLLRRMPSIDLRLVHLVRDSRGVAFSWQKHVAKATATGVDDELVRYNSLAAALRWDVYNAMTESLRGVGVPYLRVRYEDVVRDPGRHLRQILDHAGGPVDDDALAFVHDGRAMLDTGHTVDGNPMRFTNGPLVLRTDEEWKTKLPRRDRVTVTALTSPMLARYGYSVRSSNS